MLGKKKKVQSEGMTIYNIMESDKENFKNSLRNIFQNMVDNGEEELSEEKYQAIVKEHIHKITIKGNNLIRRLNINVK